MTYRWPIPVSFQLDESISSWLVRAALEQGCDPLVLTGTVWSPRWHVWAMDVDRGLTSEKISPLSQASGISEDTFKTAGVTRDIEKMVAHELPKKGNWPWLLTLGMRNRKRFGGMQFCPVCLAGDRKPYFRRRWRYAWRTACLEHGIRLQNRCPSCIAPIEPHRLTAEDKHLAMCATCKFDLRRSPRHNAKEGALMLQKTAENALSQGNASYMGNHLTVSEWFDLVRFFIGLVRRSTYSNRVSLKKALGRLGIDLDRDDVFVSGLVFESMTVKERETLLDSISVLLETSPDRLLEALLDAKVSVQVFEEKIPAPPILSSVAHALPTARKFTIPSSNQSGSRSKRVVMTAWIRLQRKMRTLPS